MKITLDQTEIIKIRAPELITKILIFCALPLKREQQFQRIKQEA